MSAPAFDVTVDWGHVAADLREALEQPGQVVTVHRAPLSLALALVDGVLARSSAADLGASPAPAEPGRVPLAGRLGQAVATAVYHAGPPVAWGLVIWLAWPWFAVPAFGVGALSYWRAVGLGLLVRALRPNFVSNAEVDAMTGGAGSAWRWWWRATVVMPGYSLALLLIARWLA